jgi:hypothetical protein
MQEKIKEGKKAMEEGNEPKPSHPSQRQDARSPLSTYGGGGGCRILAIACGGGEGVQLKLQLMIQRIPDARGEMCSVLWDTGAQISLVTHQYAREAGFKGRPASIRISGVGTGNKNKSKVQYRALLRRRDGSIAEFTPYRVERRTGDAVRMNLDKAKALFPSAAASWNPQKGRFTCS